MVCTVKGYENPAGPEDDRMKARKGKEPKILVMPLGRFGGLDNAHVAMLALIVILVALLIAISYNGPIRIAVQQNATLNCTYAYNGMCAKPVHNATDIKLYAERLLASYNYLNTSLSLLPYLAEVSKMNATFMPQTGNWYVSVPVKDSFDSNSTVDFSMLINDSNLNESATSIETVKPVKLSSNYAVSEGVILVGGGKVSCESNGILPIYWFIDPYAPGSISSLQKLIGIESRFKGKVNASLEILYTQSSGEIANNNGLNGTLAFGKYLYCASHQSGFNALVKEVNSTYVNAYMSPSELDALAVASGLNMSAMDSCISSAGTPINRQAVLASYYNVTSTPSVITDCKYLSIPQTAISSVCYANSSIC